MKTRANMEMGRSLLSLLALLAAGVTTTPALADKTTIYQVEVIVFRNVAGADGRPAAAPDGPDQGSAPATTDQSAYPLLAPGELGLNGAFQQLGRSADFRPMAHLGWRQATGTRTESAVLRVPRDITERTGLAGSFRLYRQGNLYLDVALTLPGSGPQGSDGRAREARIREVRRIRGATLQYFDDAGFGVIAQVRPLDAAPASTPR